MADWSAKRCAAPDSTNRCGVTSGWIKHAHDTKQLPVFSILLYCNTQRSKTLFGKGLRCLAVFVHGFRVKLSEFEKPSKRKFHQPFMQEQEGIVSRIGSTFASRILLPVLLHFCFDTFGNGIKRSEPVRFPSATQVFLCFWKILTKHMRKLGNIKMRLQHTFNPMIVTLSIGSRDLIL
jgi:hypothetical protein